MNMPIPKSEPEALDALAADIAKVQPPAIDQAAQDAATVNDSATSEEYARKFLAGAWGCHPTTIETVAFSAFILGRNDGIKKADKYAAYVRNHFADADPVFAGNRSDSYRPREDPEPFDEFTGPCPDDDEQAAIPDGYRVLPDSGGAGRWAAWFFVVLAAVAVLGIVAYYAFGGTSK